MASQSFASPQSRRERVGVWADQPVRPDVFRVCAHARERSRWWAHTRVRPTNEESDETRDLFRSPAFELLLDRSNSCGVVHSPLAGKLGDFLSHRIIAGIALGLRVVPQQSVVDDLLWFTFIRDQRIFGCHVRKMLNAVGDP